MIYNNFMKELSLIELVESDNFSTISSEYMCLQKSVKGVLPSNVRTSRLFRELIDHYSLSKLSDNQLIEGLNLFIKTPNLTSDRQKILLKEFKYRCIDFSDIFSEGRLMHYKVRLEGKNIVIAGDVSAIYKAKIYDQAARMNNDIDKAIHYSTKAIELDSTKFAYWFFRGILHTRIPPSQRWYYYEDNPNEFKIRMQNALDDFDRSISLVDSKKFHAIAHARKAEVLHRLEKKQKTIEEITKSLKADYSNKGIDFILNKLKISREKILIVK